MNAAERHDHHTGWDDVNDATEDGFEAENTSERLQATPDLVEVRRNGGLSAVIGAGAAAMAIAWLARATGSGAVWDWLVVAVLAVIAGAHLRSFVDARTPLLVADTQGVRIRLGHSWTGLPWGALSEVEVTPRRGLVRDGRVVFVPRNPDRVLAELDRGGRWQTALATRMYGDPFALPLGFTTKVTGDEGDLAGSLTALAGADTSVVEVLPTEAAAETEQAAESNEAAGAVGAVGGPGTEDARDGVRAGVALPFAGWAGSARTRMGDLSTRTRARADRFTAWLRETGEDEDRTQAREELPAGEAELPPAVETAEVTEVTEVTGDGEATEASETSEAAEPVAEVVPEPIRASSTPAPLREARVARRSEFSILRLDRSVDADVDADTGVETETAKETETEESRYEAPTPTSSNVRPIARPGEPVEPLVLEDFDVEPAANPVIGPELAAARTRLGLSVDALAERTRIRPHVIESIEVDDFAPCGGDFYARGHLRTLARVLGVEVTDLMREYDVRYADAPINPRRVFEAELASSNGGAIRGTRGGANWSLMIAVVMFLVLIWSLAQLLMTAAPESRVPAPTLNGSGGTHSQARLASSSTGAGTVPVRLNAANGTSQVTVKDASGDVVFTGDLALGTKRELNASAPFRVTASDGGAVEVTVAGSSRGTVGDAGQEATRTFAANDE